MIPSNGEIVDRNSEKGKYIHTIGFKEKLEVVGRLQEVRQMYKKYQFVCFFCIALLPTSETQLPSHHSRLFGTLIREVAAMQFLQLLR